MPAFHSELPADWNRITHPDYQDIHWTYSNAPALTCNGIKIYENVYHTDQEWMVKMQTNLFWEGQAFDIRKPNISVFDYDANLPLNVQRTGLTQEEYPFQEELLNDIFRDLIASLIVNTPYQYILVTSSFESYLSRNMYQGIRYHNTSIFPWFYTKFGISIAKDPWFISQVDSGSALSVPLYWHYPLNSIPMQNIVPNSSIPVFVSRITGITYTAIKLSKTLNDAIKEAFNVFSPYEKLKQLFISGRRALISRHVLDSIGKVSKLEMKNLISEKIMSKIVEEWKNDNWVLWRLGDCPEPGFDFEKFAAENDGKNYHEWPCVLAEWYFKDPKPQVKESEMSPLAKVWRDVVGTPIIPFDLEERRSMKAYKELKTYIEAHEKVKKG